MRYIMCKTILYAILGTAVAFVLSNHNVLAEDWTRELGGGVNSSPIIADINEDGVKEIIVGCSAPIDIDYAVATLFVLNYDGTDAPYWEGGKVLTITKFKKNVVYLASDSIVASPIVADIDGDRPGLEIVVGTTSGLVYVFHSDGSMMHGWPKQTAGAIIASPAIGEIVKPAGSGGKSSPNPQVIIVASGSYVYAWYGDGTPVEGWLGPKNTHSPCIHATPVVVTNFDHEQPDANGGMHVIVATEFGGRIYAWHLNDGSSVPYWSPKIVMNNGYMYASPAVADLDHSSYSPGPEIVIACTDWRYNHLVYVFNSDGIIVRGWPKRLPSIPNSSPAIGDIDLDGDLEIVIGAWGDSCVYAWHHNGRIVEGWPKVTSLPPNELPYEPPHESEPDLFWAVVSHMVSSPSIADIDGDPTNGLEIVIGSYDHKVYAWHAKGGLVEGWPKETGESVYSSAAIEDTENDGTKEIVIGSFDGNLYLWTSPDPAENSRNWPMFRQNIKRTGELN